MARTQVHWRAAAQQLIGGCNLWGGYRLDAPSEGTATTNNHDYPHNHECHFLPANRKEWQRLAKTPMESNAYSGSKEQAPPRLARVSVLTEPTTRQCTCVDAPPNFSFWVVPTPFEFKAGKPKPF